MCVISVGEGCQHWGFDLSLNPALSIKWGIDHRLDLFLAIFFFPWDYFLGPKLCNCQAVLTLAEVVH